ncbi:tyrosine transporter [Anabaena sphaerica FACHB-251]|uniref:Tyrosine transporter n=1 Tax=Anabaena sphaerica FACHB-251 TaxID=2692883 RepID=A0A926WE53_9NOST|nr:aromatic amino acid transport family protein [Anabaena sphaerica]MBD2292951.1 tyrosine transporter [Anabaena sphaerica FACHB-251]
MKTVLKSEQTQITRLFSHLEFDGNKLNHQPGSVLGSTALIAGTTIGAGILALPAVTLPSGILPSTIAIIVVWLYTLFSGLLIAEVSLNVMGAEGIPSIGFLAIVEKTLGKVGARIAGATYLFMHYALLVAYISKGGDILVSTFAKIAGLDNILPNWVGTTTFTFLFGGILYLGKERFIQKLNGAFVAIVIISFIGLLLLGSGQVKSEQFLFQNWNAVGSAVSVICVALFYHNVVPVVVTQLEGDLPKIRKSIIIGSAIPLIMFLAWNAVILGSVNPDILQNPSESGSVFDPLQILRSGGGGELLGLVLTVFSEFAIITSFIGFVYGLVDFFKDISRITKGELSRLPIFSLVLFPPMSLGTINPSIFFTALDYTGIFSISVLGGIIPAIMSWQQRNQQKLTNGIYQSLIPGGKITLTLMITVALALIGKQIFSI